LFLTKYLFPFELASILLLVAAVGAVVLARRRRGLEAPDEELELRLRAPRPAYTGTMAEAAGTRIIETVPEPERVGEVSTHEGGW
jgi:NADH-quinone oxidoreductase subunit J